MQLATNSAQHGMVFIAKKIDVLCLEFAQNYYSKTNIYKIIFAVLSFI